MTKPTIDDVYEDIRNIGRIFNVEDRADKSIAPIDNSIRDVKERMWNSPSASLCTMTDKMYR